MPFRHSPEAGAILLAEHYSGPAILLGGSRGADHQLSHKSHPGCAGGRAASGWL